MFEPCLIDLSHWNEPRPLVAAKAAGIRAAIVKCTQGSGGFDPMFFRHCEEVRRADLLLGAYHFGTGATSGGAQATSFLKAAQSSGSLPNVLVLDLEHNPRGEHMTLQQAEEFIRELRLMAPAARLVIYGGQYLRELNIPSTSPVAACWLWLADYREQPKIPAPWTQFVLWQYTDGSHGPMPREIADLGPRDYSVERLPGTLERLWGMD